MIKLVKMKILIINIFFLVLTFSLTTAIPCCEPGDILNEDRVCVSRQFATKPVSLTCSNTVLIVDKKDLNLTVNHRGQLELLLSNRIVTYGPDDFCEGLMHHKRSASRVALICSDEDKQVISEKVYGWCMLVSAAFLYFTACWYGIGAHRRDLLGKSIINLCVSLAMGLSILAAMKLVPYSDMNLCAARGFFTYFFVLVSFFWTNAVSMQILFEMKHGQMDIGLQKRYYVWCAVYAWGIPTMLTIMMAVINFIPGDHLKPGIGLNHCWFFDVAQQWQYMYSVMTLLITINISIFIAVTVSICCTGTMNDSFKQKFVTCIRLLFVMGIPWVFEMIDSLTPQHIAWEIIDLFNALQGVWICIVLVLLRPKEPDVEHKQYNNNITIASIGNTDLPYIKLSK